MVQVVALICLAFLVVLLGTVGLAFRALDRRAAERDRVLREAIGEALGQIDHLERVVSAARIASRAPVVVLAPPRSACPPGTGVSPLAREVDLAGKPPIAADMAVHPPSSDRPSGERRWGAFPVFTPAFTNAPPLEGAALEAARDSQLTLAIQLGPRDTIAATPLGPDAGEEEQTRVMERPGPADFAPSTPPVSPTMLSSRDPKPRK